MSTQYAQLENTHIFLNIWKLFSRSNNGARPTHSVIVAQHEHTLCLTRQYTFLLKYMEDIQSLNKKLSETHTLVDASQHEHTH